MNVIKIIFYIVYNPNKIIKTFPWFTNSSTCPDWDVIPEPIVITWFSCFWWSASSIDHLKRWKFFFEFKLLYNVGISERYSNIILRCSSEKFLKVSWARFNFSFKDYFLSKSFRWTGSRNSETIDQIQNNKKGFGREMIYLKDFVIFYISG